MHFGTHVAKAEQQFIHPTPHFSGQKLAVAAQHLFNTGSCAAECVLMPHVLPHANGLVTDDGDNAHTQNTEYRHLQ